MRSLLVENIILLLALNTAVSEAKGWGSRSLRGDGGKKIDQKFTTKPKSKSVLEPSGVTENIGLKPGKPSAYEKYFDDPKWDRQWFMHDYRTVDGPVMDHNVVPVYERGFHGQNVHVAVVDDGIVQHYDLQQSYDHGNSLSCGTSNNVFKDGSADYAADFGYNKHGTRLAGIIGMDENDKCGVGIARKAKLISINVYHGWYTNDNCIGQALNYNLNNWDVFCLGWGLPTSAFKKKKLMPKTQDAISNGFTKGRGSKGAIYVTTPGMSKGLDSCLDDPLANHPDTFSIGIANNHGKIIIADDNPIRCAAIIATAYGGGDSDDDEGVLTVSPIDDPKYETGCIQGFRSASIASSVASGIIALVLSANGALTSRDVMHLIVAGSEVAPLAANEGTWSVNKAGFWFSNDFGFGLLNADNMVELALKWTPVPERHVCFINQNFAKNKELQKDVEISISLNTVGCQDNKDAIFFMEQIQLDATIDYSKKGAPSIVVVSPKGTSSQMSHPSIMKNKSVLRERSLKSYHHWGEDPNGTWTVKIKLEGVSGSLKDLSITLYGTKDKPAHYKATAPYRSYSAFRVHDGTTVE